jgi:hypothetical protein
MFLTLPNTPKITFDFPVPELIRSLGTTQTNTQTTSTTNAPTTPSTTLGQIGNIPDNEKEKFLRLIDKEARCPGTLGMALVARSVLNRQALIKSGVQQPGTFNAKSSSLTDIIQAPGQYQPYSQGLLNQALSETDRAKAEEALKLALNPEELTKQLRAAGKTEDEIKKLMAATGFRAGSAFCDPSQNVGNVTLLGHTFNVAGNPLLKTFGDWMKEIWMKEIVSSA